MPTTAALGARFLTTCAQPPGAMPRSTTRVAPFTKPKRSSSSMSLNAARLRQPSSLAFLT